jgi:hypothetical protein
MPEWEMVKEIAESKNAQFLSKKVTFRSGNPIEVFNR